MNLSTCIKAGSRDGEAGYLIGFAYDREIVEQLKQQIPHTYREWHPNENVWWISIEYEAVLIRLFKNFYALAHLQGSLF